MIDPIEQQILDYITEYFPAGSQRASLDPDSNLLESGMIDSLAIFRIIHFLEEQFGLEIAPEDVISENFESVGAISSMVQERRE